ncbi:MAG: rRNA maturation RNase YbeY, partial [Bdellovibrionales bacterium RIFOXYC2_FULL_39_8]
QAKAFKLSVAEEMIYLGVHGLLHLLGYDHEKNAHQAAVMFKEEEVITNKIF